MSDTPENKPLVAVGGNSRLARSMRARLQWRDRFGRWIEMGRGVKFKVRGSDGAPRSVIGKFVGAIDDKTGQVYVSKDPNGLPDGFYQVKSNNAQEIIADLSPRTLNQRGIELGKDINGNEVGERMSEDIPSISQIVRSDAPEGWKMLPDTLGGRKVIETDDGDFRIAFGGQDGKWIVENRAARGKGFAFNNPGEAFQDVEDQDARNGETPAAPSAPQQDDLDAQIARQQEAYNQAYVSGNEARIQAAKQVLDDLKAQKESQGEAPEAPAEQNAPSGGIDTDTFDVAKEGFLVPTGKKTNDTSAEGLANFITSQKEALSKGGARLVVDSDSGEAEIYNSADTVDDAKAQAGGLGQDTVLDLSTGQAVKVSDGAVDPNSPDVNPNLEGDTSQEAPNAEDRNPDAVESQPANPGADAPASPEPNGEAQRTEQPAAPAGADPNAARPAGEPDNGAAPAAERPAAPADSGDADQLERETKIAEARARIAEIDARIEEIDQELEQNRARQAELRGEAPEAPREPEAERPPLEKIAPETEATPENLPEPGTLADLQARRESFQRDFEAADDINQKLGLSQEMRKLDQEIARKQLDEAPETPEQADAPETDEPSLEVPEVNVDTPDADELPFNTTDEAPVDTPKNNGEMVEAPKIQVGDVIADWFGEPRLVISNSEFNPRGDRMLRFPAEQGKQGFWLVSPVAEIERLDDTDANIIRKEFNEGPRPDLAGRFTLAERTVLVNGKKGDVVKRNAYPEDVVEGDWVRHPDGFDVQIDSVSQVEDDERGPGFEINFDDGDSFFLSRADRLDIVKGPDEKAPTPNADEDAVRLMPDDGDLIRPEDVPADELPEVLDAARRLRDIGEPGLDDYIAELEYLNNQYQDNERLTNASYEIFNGNAASIPDDELASRIGNLEDAERSGFISPEMEGELRALREEANRRFSADNANSGPRPDLAQVQRVENGQVVFDTRDEGDQRVAPNNRIPVRDLQPGDRFYDENGRLVEVVSVNLDPNVVGNVAILDENGNRASRDMALDYPVQVVRDAPAAQNAPEAPQTPAPAENPADGLPESVEELEALAGRLERQIDGARGARQRVLQQEVDRIYDRIDELNGEAGTPDNGSDGDVEMPPADIDEIADELDEIGLPEGMTNEPLATWERELLDGRYEDAPGPEIDPVAASVGHESKVRVARAKLEGKDVNESEREEYIRELQDDGLTDRELDRIAYEIDNLPNRANTVTAPKPENEQPDRHSTMNAGMAQEENNPNHVPNDDRIWDQVKRENPGYVLMPNGDMIIESNYNYVDKHGNDRGKGYQLVVRHTLDNRFQAYILERDKETGNRVALRVGVETHSYKALSKYIMQGRNQVRDNRSLHVTVSRAKNGKEVLGRDRQLGDDIIQRFLDGGMHIPDENVGRNVALAGIVARIQNGQASDDILADLPEIAKSDADLADAIRQAFYVRSIKKAFVKRRARREPHVDYDGKLIEKGQYFDWTDWREELDVHSPRFRRPNPNYGKVYRGQIKGLMERNAAGEYEYSDNVQVKFEPNQGLNSNKWVKRVAANLRIVDGPNAPLGEPFFAKVEEKRNPEAVAEAFGVPKAGARPRTKPRPEVEPAFVGRAKVNADGFIEGFENVYVPKNADDTALAVFNGEPRAARAKDLQPGELIIGNGPNGITAQHVLRVSPAGSAARMNILAVQRVGSRYEFVNREVPADQMITRWDAIQKPAPIFKRGEVVNYGGSRYIVKGIDPDGGVRVMARGLVNRDLVIPADMVSPETNNQPLIPYETRMELVAKLRETNLSEVVKRHHLGVLANPDINQVDVDIINRIIAQAKDGNDRPKVNFKDILAQVAGAPIADRVGNVILNAEQDENIVGIGAVKYRDINSDNFVSLPRVDIDDLRLGDVFQVANADDGHLVWMQITDTSGREGAQVRVIGERPTSKYRDAWGSYPNGAEFTMSYRKIRTGVNPKRMVPGKLTGLYQRIEVGENSGLLDRIREKSEWLKKAWDAVAENVLRDAANGRKDNMGGAAADIAKIVDTPDGKKMFIKRSPERPEVNLWPRKKAMWSEVLGNRLAGALGIVGPNGGPMQGEYDEDNGFYLGEVIDGEAGADAGRYGIRIRGFENQNPVVAAIDHMWDIPNAWRIGLFDALTQNGDRHNWNWMVGRDGNVYPIDHGNIHWGRGARAVRSRFASKFLDDISSGTAPITSAELLRLKNEFASMRGEFQAAGQGDWFNNVYANFQEIIDKVKRHGN
ncbi:hypothetical protein QEH42_gp082 [Microbacterium phage Pumpernickel]|uniref:Uncharacterized protein n=1 Tax=Microbacterium phage Pumpernickel TaxID=2885983 RepID=A0AAE9C2F6_9CAUD|nr:hypothetical protein QEH42_gp082 [Microbacterium phage Pumpernickel]UDL15873.1 hypothetical protein SEA_PUMPERNICKEL_82 [Microbacterium phage Pumpernickel]